MKRSLVLCYLFLSTAFMQDFPTVCEQLTDGTTVKSLYYRSTCYVSDKTTGKKYDDVTCEHLDRPGYLAILPGSLLLNKMFNYFGASYFPDKWIGLKRNQTTSGSSPASSREFWYWQGGAESRRAEPDVTIWSPGEPNNAGNTCGNTYSNGKIYDYTCTYTGYGSLCQYRGPRMFFKEVARGVRATESETIEEHTVQNHMQCSTKCHRLLPCQSYTYSSASGLCVLQLLPAEDTSTQLLEDGVMFDLI